MPPIKILHALGTLDPGGVETWLLALLRSLPIAVIEAQAAGLSCVISSEISKEVKILPQQVVQLPLALGPKEWARITIKLIDQGKFETQTSLRAMQQTDFSIDRSLTMLMNLYSGLQFGNRAI